MRLFVAADPPVGALAHLGAAVDRVRDGSGPDLRWQDPTRWHLTLAFLGEVPDRRADRLADRLSRVAARHAPVGPLHLRGAGVFGRRVLWVGVEAAEGEPGTEDQAVALHRLATAVQNGMRHEGVAIPSRGWRPHVTVARQRGDSSDGARRAAEALSDYGGPAWMLTELRLVRSRLGPHPRHDTVATARLSDTVRPGPPPSGRPPRT